VNRFSRYSPSSEDEGIPPAPPTAPRALLRFPANRAVVSYTLLTITVMVYLVQMVSQWLLGNDLPAALGLKANALILQGQVWRLITPVFLHGSILHLGFNMYALYIFGPGLERHFGHVRFLALYLLSGFAGNVLSFIFSTAPSLGSSTAIFGLLGAEGVFLYRNRGVFGGFARRALSNIVMIALVNFVIGFTPGIDNWGHLGGLLGGTLFAWFGGPLLNLEGIYPLLTVTDRRSRGEVFLAGLGVGLLFALLVVLTALARR
jgi:rhomboid protease GluP